MADLDLETVEQVARWCAEAGRQAGAAEIRAALGGLSWDELLAVRALLADPPPARPLGPYALADLARGAPLDAAAERERDGRYPRGPAGPDAPARAESPPDDEPVRATRKRGKARQAVIVRKKAPAPAEVAPPPRPLVDVLMLPAGRAALEKLVRTHGGRRPALVAALGATHRRPDGQPMGEADLDRLLEHHGQARAFARRERDEVLHAVRAAAGVLGRAAAALGYDAAGLDAAVARLGCRAEVESIRAGKRQDLAGRGTLSDRARLVISDPEKLGELGLLEPFEAELKARLPELIKALDRSGEPLALALARSLSMPAKGVRQLAEKLGFDLGPVTWAEAEASDRPPPRFRPEMLDQPQRPPRTGPPRAGAVRSGPPRSGPPADRTARSGPPGNRPARSGPPGDRPARSGPPRSGPARSRPPGDRPIRNDRPSRMGGALGRPSRPAGAGQRPAFNSSPRPGGAGARTGRPSGPPRPGGPRPSGPRSPGARPGGPSRGAPRGPRRPPRTP